MNYNGMGWLFFPLALFGLHSGIWWLVIISWIGVSFGSITVLFIGGGISIIYAILLGNNIPLIVIIPAFLRLIPNFYPLFKSGSANEKISNIAKLIGLNQGKKVRYKYPRPLENLFSFEKVFLIITQIQFLLVIYVYFNKLDYFLLFALIVYILNSSYARFADEQSMWMLIISVAIKTIITESNSALPVVVIVSFWILINPLPNVVMLGKKWVLRMIPYTQSLSPVNIKPIMDKFHDFISSINPDSKILIAFDDPKSVYNNIFDGLRFHIEFLFYAASQRKILIFPDWMAVVENNVIDAPNFWGRMPNDIINNLKLWQADFVIIYQEESNKIDPIWYENGFHVISKCSFLKAEFQSKDGSWFPYKNLYFFLLKSRA
jgi:hypothetical protein